MNLQDYAQAMIWFQKAADQGDADAQHNLGLMYLKGDGVPQDYVLAYMWFNIAAAGGNKAATQARDTILARLTRAQRKEAQKLSREWKPTPAK